MPVDIETERDRRRTFNSLLILANLFRILSYFIVGLAGTFTVLAVAAAIVSRQVDTLLQLITGSSSLVLWGLLLFLGSELIRLLVGIGKDISRMSGRNEGPGQREPSSTSSPAGPAQAAAPEAPPSS